ncbi:MAG: phage holin family protein [Micrococcaceae bacterium]
MVILQKIAVNAVALWLATLLVPGISVGVSSNSELFSENNILVQNPAIAAIVMYLIVGTVMGFINVFIKPIAKLLSFPITLLTIGLFTFVINALMLMLTAFLSQSFPAVLTVNSFLGTAVPASIIITFTSMLLNNAAKKN